MEKTMPGYRYFDHEADVGIIAEGKTLEEAFTCGAQAMVDLILDSGNQNAENFKISVSSEDLLSLWIDFLNKLLAEMDIQKIFFLNCKIRKIEKGKEGYLLTALAQYVKKDKITAYKSEVKAATFCKAAVEKTNDGYQVQCVLDI